MPPDQQKKETVKLAKVLALAMELPFILIAGVLIGGAAGYWLDARFHTSPLFTLVLGLLGFGAGLREIIRRLPKDNEKNGDG